MDNEIGEISDLIEETGEIRIWYSILGVLSLYAVILIFANFILGKIVSQEVLSAKPYLYTINLFVILTIYFFIIIFLLKIHGSDLAILQSLKKKFSRLKLLPIIFGLGVVVSFVFLLFLLLSSYISSVILGGELILDFRLLWVSYDYSDHLYRALIPGIWEEVAFRGVVLVLLLKRYSKKASLIINSVLFGFFHLINLANIWGAVEPVIVLINVAFQIVYATAAGFVFAYLFLKTESLVPSILAHYLLDALGPFLQVIFFPGGYTLAEIAIVRTSQTIIGIGFIPAIVNMLIVYLVYKMWKKEPFLDVVEVTSENQNQIKTDSSV